MLEVSGKNVEFSLNKDASDKNYKTGFNWSVERYLRKGEKAYFRAEWVYGGRLELTPSRSYIQGKLVSRT